MIELREITEHADLVEAVRLQKEIWGFEDVDLLPLRLFVVAAKVGGQVLAAYDENRMIGFCLSIPGVKPGGAPYLHSHMMGVHAEYRNRGVGRMLKLRQRADALGREIGVIEWTFDPLEIKNAFFNIERLGAVVRRYVLNQYGISSSHLHGGLPTDRCVAEWRIGSPRVSLILDGDGPPHTEFTERITVPAEIAGLRHTDPPQAAAMQKRISEAFLDCFSRNLTVAGFLRSEAAGVYLLAPWETIAGVEA